MDKQTALLAYQSEYNVPFAVKVSSPMVAEVLENKHGIDNPVSDLNTGAAAAGVTGDLQGSLRTTDAIPVTVSIASLPVTKPLMLLAKITAVNAVSGYYAGFMRIAILKNVSGTVAAFDQIQDAFTMRQQNYDVDFVATANNVQLRVWGLAGQDISWTYSVSVINFI